MLASDETDGGRTTPWLRADLLSPIPSPRRGHYGYIEVRKEAERPRVVKDLDALRKRIARTANPVELAWTPDDTHVRPVYEIADVADAVESRARRDARLRLRRAWPRALLLVALVGLGIAFWPASRGAQAWIFLAAFLGLGVLWGGGVEALVGARLDLGALREVPARWRSRQAAALRFERWSTDGRTITGLGLVMVCTVLFVSSMVAGRREAFDALALVPARVADGEVWRLFTCTLLHGNMWHIYFNSVVALALAVQAGRLVSESRVLLTFVVSALAGSAASVVFTGQTSVGASGGILGWGGLLAGIGCVDPEVRRAGVLGSMFRWVILLALIGWIGAGFIDNAAHAGGFLAGLALGVVFGRRTRRGPLPVGGAGLGLGFWLLAVPALAGATAMLVFLVIRISA